MEEMQTRPNAPFQGGESPLAATDPEWVAITTAFARQEVPAASPLTEKERMLCILAALLGCQGMGAFRKALGSALDAGVEPVAIREAIYQATAYLGIGRVQDFLAAANEVMAQHGIRLPLPAQGTTDAATRFDKGLAKQVSLFGEGMARVQTDEDVWEMEFTHRRFPAEVIPMGAVVTASGTGAEMNGGAVITNEDKKLKAGMAAAAPRFAALDPAYTLTLPMPQVLSGAFDTLSHAMETYFGQSDGDNASDDVALAVMRNTVVNMRRVLKDKDDLEARSNLMWDSAMAENGILKVGRKTDFQAHQMEHQLGAYTDCNHGQGLAVIHPAYYRHIVKDAPEKFARLGQAVFGLPADARPEAAVDALAAFIAECGLPTKLGQLRSTVTIDKDLLRKVADSCNLIPANPRTLTHDEVYDILCECL